MWWTIEKKTHAHTLSQKNAISFDLKQQQTWKRARDIHRERKKKYINKWFSGKMGSNDVDPNSNGIISYAK